MRGFTLIEVLVSLAIGALIAGAIMTTYIAIERTRSHVEENSLKQQEARNLLSQLSTELASLYVNSEDKRTFFILKDRDIYGRPASHIEFTSFGIRGLMKFQYHIKEEEDGKRLNLIKTTGPAFREETLSDEIIEDIDGFLIEVTDRGTSVRTWDTGLTGRAPEKIKISLWIKIGQRRLELSETVQPRMIR
jgi:general secretion pathway protein J